MMENTDMLLGIEMLSRTLRGTNDAEDYGVKETQQHVGITLTFHICNFKSLCINKFVNTRK